MQGNKVKRTSEIGCGVAGHRKIILVVCAGMALAVAVALARGQSAATAAAAAAAAPDAARLRRLERDPCAIPS